MQSDIVNTVTFLEYIPPPPPPPPPELTEEASIVREDRTIETEGLGYLDFMTQITTATETSPESRR